MSIKEVELPEGVEASYNDNVLAVKGPKAELARRFSNPKVVMQVRDRKIVIESSNERRKNKAILGTWAAHTRNMVQSSTGTWETILRIVYSHFPMKVNFDQANRKLEIKNFLGERSVRHAKIEEGVMVEVKGNDILITGHDREKVGQSAANIEQVTRVKGFDRRVFQDGCHLVQKTRLVEEDG